MKRGIRNGWLSVPSVRPEKWNSSSKGLSGNYSCIIVERATMNPASHSPLTFLAGPCIRNAYTSLVSKEKLGNEVARSLMYRARVIGKKEAISQLPALFVFLRMPLIDVLAVPIAVFSFFFFFLRNATIIDKLDRGSAGKYRFYFYLLRGKKNSNIDTHDAFS